MPRWGHSLVGLRAAIVRFTYSAEVAEIVEWPVVRLEMEQC